MSRIQSLKVVLVALIIGASAFCAGAVAAETSEPKKISFDDLKFENKNDAPFKRSMLGEKIEALDGHTVSIRGWMMATSFFERKAKSFILIHDAFETSFGPGKPLHESIMVEMKPGETAEFTTSPITVEGAFRIREYKIDGKVYALYQIQATTVKPITLKPIPK